MPLSATVRSIPSGAEGLRVKLRVLRELAEKAKREPEFRRFAASLVRHLPEKDHTAEIGAVVDFVKSNVRYLRDPYSAEGLELFTTPQQLLADALAGEASEDCDGHVGLAVPLLETIGYRTRFRIGAVPGPDGRPSYRHIWADVQHPELGWVPIELTRKDGAPLFWDPSPRFPITETHNLQGLETMTYTTRPELFAQPGLSAIFGPSRGSDAWDTLNDLGRFRLKRSLKKAVKKVAKVAHTAVKVAVPVYGAATLLKKKKRRATPAAAEPIEPPEVPADLAPVPYEASIQVQPTYMQRGMVQVAAPVPAALTYAEPSAYDGAQPVYARQVAVAPMVQRTGGYEFQADGGGYEPEYVEDPPAPPLYEQQPDLFQNEGEEVYGLGSGGMAGLGKFSLKKIGKRVGKALKPLARPLLKTAAGLVGAGGLVDMFDQQKKQVAAAAASQGPPSPAPAGEKKGDATPWVIGGAAAVALLLLMKKR